MTRNSCLKFAAAVAGAVSLLSAGSAAAAGKVISLATTKGGATAQVASAISKEVSTKTDMQMRNQVLGGTQQYIPIVNAGEIDFGLSNLPQYTMAKHGTGLSAGKKYDNLRLVSTLMVFRVGPVVAKNSGINKIADLKGKRAPAGFKAAPLFNYIAGAFLANAGLTMKDEEAVPVVALRQHWTMFKEGKLDFVVCAVGTGILKELDVTVPGGIKYVSLDTSPAAVKRTLAVYPGSYIAEVKPSKGNTGVLSPVSVIHFDYVLWANRNVPDEVVYKTVKAMYENEADLKASSPLWKTFHRKNMAKDQHLAYHEGALKFYKEVGLR